MSNIPVDEVLVEQKIKEVGADIGPRLTPDMIEGKIVNEQYYVFPGTTLTVCVLTLQNGFVVSGTSAAASPENFNEEVGRQIARKNARNKIWELEGYLLREKLSVK